MSKYHYPHGHIFYRRMSYPHPMIDRGEGVYLYDQDGTRYLDASGGPLVVNLGHGVRQITDAITEQLSKVGYIHARQFTSQSLEDYAAALAKITPLPNPRFYLVSSGSEANETAIKLARQIQVERGQLKRHLTIARQQSYHGTTLGALAVTGKPKMRNLFRPIFADMPHIPAPYCYRCPFELAYPQCDLRCASALEAEIKQTGPENIAAFIAEPISGSTLGAVSPPPEYWPRIRQICDRYEVLLIVDEVLTGMGRTGRWFAIQHWNVTPDIITMGKGSAGGYFPLSVVGVSTKWVDMIADGRGEFVHGGTYSHHVVGAAAGLATLNYLHEYDLVDAVSRKGPLLGDKLRTALGDLPVVGDIRGKGFLWGIEFVSDRNTKKPFPPGRHFAQQVADAAFERGLGVYPGSGCVDGVDGDHVTIGPPFIITDEQMDELVELLRQAIEAVMGRQGKEQG